LMRARALLRGVSNGKTLGDVRFGAALNMSTSV
jgi:hypothetical protein